MARKKKTLLIVDDEVNVTRTLQMVFEDEGYSVTPAYSCAEALKIMKNGHQFDGVITDLNMERDDSGDAVLHEGALQRRQRCHIGVNDQSSLVVGLKRCQASVLLCCRLGWR